MLRTYFKLVLVAATAQALYVERNGALVKVWDASPEAPISGLAQSGRGVWLAMGKGPALFRGAQLLRGAPDVLPERGRIVGSQSGDVWVLGGPQLVRMGERAPGGSDEDRWRRNLLPIFHRSCRGCHLPGGSAGTDLSSVLSSSLASCNFSRARLTSSRETCRFTRSWALRIATARWGASPSSPSMSF